MSSILDKTPSWQSGPNAAWESPEDAEFALTLRLGEIEKICEQPISEDHELVGNEVSWQRAHEKIVRAVYEEAVQRRSKSFDITAEKVAQRAGVVKSTACRHLEAESNAPKGLFSWTKGTCAGPRAKNRLQGRIEIRVREHPITEWHLRSRWWTSALQVRSESSSSAQTHIHGLHGLHEIHGLHGSQPETSSSKDSSNKDLHNQLPTEPLP